MIVCVCQSVSDREIRAAISEGAASFNDLQCKLGVATCCGKCAEAVYEVLDEAVRPDETPLVCCRKAA